MLMPKRTKYRKSMRNSRALKRNATRGNSVKFGEFGLQALEGDWISSRQIEAVRVAINRELKKMGKVVIRIFPHKPYTIQHISSYIYVKVSILKWVAFSYKQERALRTIASSCVP